MWSWHWAHSTVEPSQTVAVVLTRSMTCPTRLSSAMTPASRLSGAARWLYSEVAAPLARRLQLPALFVPPDVDGFVGLKTGAVRLRRVVEVPRDRVAAAGWHPNERDSLAVGRGVRAAQVGTLEQRPPGAGVGLDGDDVAVRI